MEPFQLLQNPLPSAATAAADPDLAIRRRSSSSHVWTPVEVLWFECSDELLLGGDWTRHVRRLRSDHHLDNVDELYLDSIDGKLQRAIFFRTGALSRGESSWPSPWAVFLGAPAWKIFVFHSGAQQWYQSYSFWF